MTKKIMFAVLLMVFLVPTVAAQLPEMCDESPQLGLNCTLVTPALDCNTFLYNVTRLNDTTGVSTQVVTNDNLSLFGTDVYYFQFNFTETNHDYVVRLCNGFTVQLTPGEKENMSFNMFVLLPFLVAAVLIALTFTLDKKHHETVRLIFGMFSFISVFVGVWMAFIGNAQFFKINDVEIALTTYLWFLIFIFFALMLYVTLYFTVRNLKKIQDQKEDDLKY